MQWTELIVFSALFLLVTVMGFVAAKWQKGDTLEHLDEWGLGGRKFGTWITWFLVGGDLYTAYTFVAVPALMFGAGAMGFFALPYTVILYPLVFLPLVRMWSVSRVHGYVTPADFVKGRYGSHWLALIIAITGIVATMPYIALQLVGLEAVLRTMGLNGSGILGHLPLFVAFVILAVYTYQSGLRAPALIAFVKDILIYIVILVAIIYLPTKFGGWGEIFNDAQAKFDATPCQDRRHPAQRQQPAAVRDAGAGQRARAVPLPALADRHPGVPRPQRDQAQHGRAAGVLAAAGPAGAARLRRDQRGHQADRQPGDRPARHQHDRPRAVRRELPVVVRGHRVRGHRHRCAGAGGDHVDRGGEPVDAQRLQGVREEERHARRRRPSRPSSRRWW